jgi:hypothetical protein
MVPGSKFQVPGFKGLVPRFKFQVPGSRFHVLRWYLIVVVVFLNLEPGTWNLELRAQHLENTASGFVRNTGTIRFRSDTGKYKNAAPYTNITNNVVEFQGTDNAFTDLNSDPLGATALGHRIGWRVPGMTRYAMPRNALQQVQQRWYTDLEMSDSSLKWIPDSVFVSGEYTIFLSGPRTYNGTFFYDGTAPQYVMQERGLSGTTDRYNNLTLINGPKNVISGMEVRMEGIFYNDSVSPVFVEGEFHWGTNSYLNAPLTVWVGGFHETGSGVSELRANVSIQNGEFLVKDLSDTVTIFPGYEIRAVNNAAALFSMGDSTHLYVLGDYRNDYGPLTNATFSTSSLVEYAGTQDPQIMQATAPSNPYGHLTTRNTVKNSNGDVYMVSDLAVRDTNIVMIPYTLGLTTGAATYTNNSEIVGNMRRDLVTADTGVIYVYNNSETHVRFATKPTWFALDVRGVTRPNDYDPTTDIFRKITATYDGAFRTTIRAGYKREDIPPTWVPTTAERLVKMYNAYPAPNERSLKLTPDLPPTYLRRPLAQSTGIAFVELWGVENTGPDNQRLDTGNDILLRASRDVLRAVASGRWSNPFTWDEAREPEPEDRVIIDGFTVHTGYIRANDNYAIQEEWPDSMALSVQIVDSPNSALLFGFEGGFNTFSLVPDALVVLTQSRIAPGLTQTDVLDQSAANIDGGLLIYRGSTFTTPNLVLTTDATLQNSGTLQVGMP